jgi:hypothetical protein
MIDAFLDWFEEHKVGVIGTLTVHSMLLFFLTLMTISNNTVSEPTLELNMEVMTPDEIQAIEERTGQQVEGPTTQVTNLTSNITAGRQQVARYLNSERLSEKVESDLRAFEQAEFERLAQERRERGEEVEMPQLDPSKWNKDLYMEKAAEPVKVEGATTVWHDLEGRVRENDVPGYLCKNEGRVAVVVSVASNGQVIKADVDASRSAQADECMIEHALRSGRRARFNASATAPDPQKGTIFFLFLRQ